MKKMFLASLMLAAVCYCAVSQAQTQPQPQAQTPPAAAVENKAPLEERFSECMKNNDCSTQARLQIIQEETDAMNDHFQKIHQACADANFQDCIDKQKEDVQAWYSTQDNMQKMMRSMQAQAMSGKEPAAGGPASSSDEEKPKTLWQKIWPYGDNK